MFHRGRVASRVPKPVVSLVKPSGDATVLWLVGELAHWALLLMTFDGMQTQTCGTLYACTYSICMCLNEPVGQTTTVTTWWERLAPKQYDSTLARFTEKMWQGCDDVALLFCSFLLLPAMLPSLLCVSGSFQLHTTPQHNTFPVSPLFC